MLSRTKIFILVTGFLLQAFLCVAQDTAVQWAGFGIELNQVAGKIFKPSSRFKVPVPKVSLATDLNFTMHTCGRKEWQQRRNYPVLGVALTYTDYGIDSIYGRCIGLYPNIQLPIISGNKLEWTVRFGLGIGYVTKHYSTVPVWDTFNNAIGSHVNNFTMLSSNPHLFLNGFSSRLMQTGVRVTG